MAIRRQMCLCAGGLLLALLLSQCKTKSESRYTKDGLFIIRIPTPTDCSENQIADAIGSWKEEGLQPEYIGVLAPGEVVTAALSGKVDVIGGHANGFVKARLAGAKITAVVNAMVDTKENPHVVYHVLRKSGISGIEGFREIAKLRKIRVAVVARNGCPDWYFGEWLERGGIHDEAVDWEVMPAKQQLEALSKGFVDVVTTHEPFINVADADPNFTRVLSSWDILQDPAAGSSVRGLTDKFIKEYPNIVGAFTRAYRKAHKWTNANPDATRVLCGKLFNLRPEQVSILTYNDRDWIDDSDVNPWIVRQVIHKDIKPDAKIRARDIYSNELNSYWIAAGRPNTVFPFDLTQAVQELRAKKD
jgi:ABC-type nitrate/sulfonate/bicarbonate transport system substrate-binding protein